MSHYILICLTCINNTDFCYFDAFYFLKLPKKAMVFMSPLIICRWIVALNIYLSRLSTLNEWTHQCSYSLLVGPRGEVRVLSLIVNGHADVFKDSRQNHLRHKGWDYGQGTIFVKGRLFINNRELSVLIDTYICGVSSPYSLRFRSYGL